MDTYINHRNGETIETDLTAVQAIKLLPAGNDFAQDLAKKWKEQPNKMSENQMFWIFKLAEQQRSQEKNTFPCDTSEILEKLEKGKLKVKYPDLGINMTLYPGGMIWLNGSKFGAYNEKGLVIFRDDLEGLDLDVVHKFLLIFAKEDFLNCMDRIGRVTGICCYCGITLTHEISKELGYGPICAEKHGRDFPYAEYERSLAAQRKRARE